MAEQLLSPDALEKNVARPVPPLAGFWFRLGALLLDLLLMRIVLQATYPLMRPVYLSLGPLAAQVVLVVLFVYALLAAGPVGKGSTLGKAVIGIRAVGLRGEPLAPGAAAMRALLWLIAAMVLLLVVLPVLTWYLPPLAIVFPPTGLDIATSYGLRGHQAIAFTIEAAITALGMSYAVANIFLIALDPLKRTAHDLAAQSLVIREAGAHNLSDFMEQIEPNLVPLSRRATRVAVIAFFVVAAISASLGYRDMSSPLYRQHVEEIEQFHRELAYGHFRVSHHLATLGLVEDALARDGLTTQSWALRLPTPGDHPTSGAHAIVFLFRSNTAIEPDQIGTTEQLDDLSSRAVSWAERQITRNGPLLNRDLRMQMAQTTSSDSLVFQPRYATLLFTEDVNLLVYRSRPRIVWNDIRPLQLPADFYDEDRRAAEKTRNEADARRKKNTPGKSP